VAVHLSSPLVVTDDGVFESHLKSPTSPHAVYDQEIDDELLSFFEAFTHSHGDGGRHVAGLFEMLSDVSLGSWHDLSVRQ
jgi:hypothetical protein